MLMPISDLRGSFHRLCTNSPVAQICTGLHGKVYVHLMCALCVHTHTCGNIILYQGSFLTPKSHNHFLQITEPGTTMVYCRAVITKSVTVRSAGF